MMVIMEDHKFKIGDCIYSNHREVSCVNESLFGKVIDINMRDEVSYTIEWFDSNPEVTTESGNRIDKYFRKISNAKLLALSL